MPISPTRIKGLISRLNPLFHNEVEIEPNELIATAFEDTLNAFYNGQITTLNAKDYLTLRLSTLSDTDPHLYNLAKTRILSHLELLSTFIKIYPDFYASIKDTALHGLLKIDGVASPIFDNASPEMKLIHGINQRAAPYLATFLLEVMAWKLYFSPGHSSSYFLENLPIRDIAGLLIHPAAFLQDRAQLLASVLFTDGMVPAEISMLVNKEQAIFHALRQDPLLCQDLLQLQRIPNRYLLQLQYNDMLLKKTDTTLPGKLYQCMNNVCKANEAMHLRAIAYLWEVDHDKVDAVDLVRLMQVNDSTVNSYIRHNREAFDQCCQKQGLKPSLLIQELVKNKPDQPLDMLMAQAKAVPQALPIVYGGPVYLRPMLVPAQQPLQTSLGTRPF